MRQLVLERPGELAWQNAAEPPPPKDGEALVRPLAVAACDLDPLIARGVWPIEYPAVLGHEFVGSVVAVGNWQPRFSQTNRAPSTVAL